MPFFTVVIPTYNRAAKLRRAVESVLNQTFTDFELLVMDDGSSDDSEEITRSFRDERVRYEWMPNSGGPATPRNRGIVAARAPWISFLDNDDIWYPDRLERVADTVGQRPSVDVVCHDEVMHVVRTGEKTRLRHGPAASNFYRVLLLDGNRLSTSAVTIRLEFLKSHALLFNEASDYVIVEDYDLWLRLAERGARFHFLDRCLGEYTIEDDNISGETATYCAHREVLLRDHVYRVQQFESDKEKLWREVAQRLALEEVGALLTGGSVLDGCRQFVRVMSTAPLVTLKHGLTRLGRKAGNQWKRSP